MAEKGSAKLNKETIDKLVAAVKLARSRAYCPYSQFRVGCAVLTEDGTIITGCNVENVSYGLTVCAERVAIMNAVSEGYRKFKAIAVGSDAKGSYKASCGACRQVIAEFANEVDLYLVQPDNTWVVVNLKDLLPMAFTPASLAQERDKD